MKSLYEQSKDTRQANSNRRLEEFKNERMRENKRFVSKERDCSSCGHKMWTTPTRRMLCGKCFNRKTTVDE